jgi:hypothetical protein
VQPTQLVVLPERFLGEVECSAQPGAAHAYVVTLTMWDDEQDVLPFVLGSSYPTSCTRSVAFQNVVTPGKLYTAEIDAYDRFADELTPFGDASSGSRRMDDAATGEPVAPRWTTRCGTGPSQATLAYLNESHALGFCAPLSADDAGVTAIAIAPTAILGSDPCAAAATLDIEPQSAALPATLDVACDAEPVLYAEGVTAGRGYAFYATTEIDGTSHGSLCTATARAGVTVAAQCGPLRTTGDVQLSLANLEVGGEPACPTGHRYDVALDDQILNATPLACEGQAQVGPLEPGDYSFGVSIFDGAGLPFGGASCAATVLAGQTVEAVCTPEP